MTKDCIIHLIVERKEPASIIYEDDLFIAFLDIHPVFLGHTLIAPKQHYKTLYDLPYSLISPLFSLTQTLGKAVEGAMEASGSFIALNNTISQSIPHLHIHIVPRNKNDGLKGFFWPRTHYFSVGHREEIKNKIKNQLIMKSEADNK